LAIYYRGPAFHFCGPSRARTFCCVAIPGRRRSQQGQHCACHQVTTLDRAKLTQRIGELNSTELSQVEDGIKAAMDLP